MTPNEEKIVAMAQRVSEVVPRLREGFDSVNAKLDTLISQAQSPTAHEAEDLSQEIGELDSAISTLEQFAETAKPVNTTVTNIAGPSGPTNPQTDSEGNVVENAPVDPQQPGTLTSPVSDMEQGQDVDASFEDASQTPETGAGDNRDTIGDDIQAENEAEDLDFDLGESSGLAEGTDGTENTPAVGRTSDTSNIDEATFPTLSETQPVEASETESPAE